jgi:hypothetical protein
LQFCYGFLLTLNVTTSLPSAYTNRTINVIITNILRLGQLITLSVITLSLSGFPCNFIKADVRLCQFNKIITFYLIDHIKHVSLFIEDLKLNFPAFINSHFKTFVVWFLYHIFFYFFTNSIGQLEKAQQSKLALIFLNIRLYL